MTYALNDTNSPKKTWDTPLNLQLEDLIMIFTTVSREKNGCEEVIDSSRKQN